MRKNQKSDGTLQNQTKPEWIGDPSELGTGIFLFSKNRKANTHRKVFIQNITYAECKIRGETSFAFKWVPHRIATYEKIQEDT